MKKSFSKRMTAVILAVVMLATSLPLVASASDAVYTKDIVNPTEWTCVASTDFTALSSTGSTNQGTMSGEYPVTSEGGNPITWTAVDFNNNVQFNTDGMYLSDGYFYISGYDGVAMPITGADEWKIELEFKFNSSWEFSTNGFFSGNTKTDRTTWLVMGTGTPYTKETNTVGSVNNVLGHDAHGPVSSRGAYLSELKSEGYTFDLTENGGWLTTGVDYKYVVSYNKDYLKVHVEDMNGVIVANICGAYAPDFHVDDLTNICFGDDNGEDYFQNTTYKSVKFYTGSTTPGLKNVDTTRTYYLFSYFTANSEEGEKIHFAVSDDGTNFEPLYGNKQILSSDYVEANNTGSGIAASNNVRDPFCIPAADGKGYYFLGTDLDTVGGTNWANNSKITVWYIDDLSKADQAQPWSLDMQDYMSDKTDSGTVSRAWAPEAVWDPEVGMYMLFWSNGYCNGGYSGKTGYTTMFYAYTKDFKTLESEPKVLYYSPYSNIDGNIMFDGELWYLVHKRESGDDATKIFVSTSEHACGPYVGTYQMYDSDNEKLEGCEIYQLTDGSYILMADSYSNPSRFVLYKGSGLDTIIRSNITNTASVNINHVRPRHGSVVAITEEEYHDLIHTYGKAVFDSSVVHEGEDVNDYLVARYFTTSDPTADIVGGNTLTNSGVTMVANQGGRTAAYFAGDATTGSSSDTAGASGSKTGSYAYINTSDMLADITAKDGITFSWYGYPTTSNSGRYFDWSTSNVGSMVWDNGDYSTNAYAYCDSAIEFGAANYGSPVLAEGYESTSSYLNTWNLYTMTITDSYICFFINGQLCRTVYSKDMSSITTQGTPLEIVTMNEGFFSIMKNANLRFGISSWGADATYQGYISDFRIYNKALSAQDVSDSLAQLSEPSGAAVDLDARGFYDPMEDMDTDEDGTNDKTAYTSTVDDPETIQGLVLNAAGGVTAHNPATTADVVDSDEGYTISMFYNPGSSIGSEAIFDIGNGAGGHSVLELSEDGQFGFWNDDAGYIMAKDVFGADTLPTDTWTHITLQIVSNGGHDLIHIYFDGFLVNTIDTFTDTSNANTLASGESIVKYLQTERTVYYGVSCGYIYGTGTCSTGYIDDFSIYSGVYSAKSIFSNDCINIATALIGIAIEDYVAKMATITTDCGFVYTNMGPAYQAYDEVLRYSYALSYGLVEMNPTEVVTLYSNLETELEKMEEYYGPKTIEGLTAAQTNGLTDVDAKFTQNMLTNTTFSINEFSNGTQDNMNMGVWSSGFVWLYDGVNTPTAPVSGGIYSNWKSTIGQTHTFYNVNVHSGDIAIGGLGLASSNDTLWHVTQKQFKDGAQEGFYLDNSAVTGYLGTTAGDTSHTRSRSDLSGKSQWNGMSMYIRYTGAPSADVSTSTPVTEYYTSFDPIYHGEYYRKWIGGSDSYDKDITSPGTIYVVNYAKVDAAMNNADNIAILNNITAYSPDSAYELLAAYDALTAIDYTKDGTQAAALQSNANSVSSLATIVKERVDNLLNQDPTVVKEKANYEKLGDTASNYMSMIDNAVYDTSSGLVIADSTIGDGSEKYTLASWNALLDAYNDVVAHMASLNPFGDDEHFVTDNAVINRLIGILENSKNCLVAVADYEPVDSVTTMGSETYQANQDGNGTSYENQAYTYSSWLPFESAYDAAEVFAKADDIIRYNTPKYRNVQYTNEGNYATGRFLAVDINGNYVSTTADAIAFVYNPTFYEYDSTTGTYVESLDYSGNYILQDDGTYLDVAAYRHGAKPNPGADAYDYSDLQVEINDKGANVTTTYEALAPVADYTVYNAIVEELKKQDMAAFKQDYINSASSVYGLVDYNGSPNGTETYNTGVSFDRTIATDAYSSQVGNGYVTANSAVYKNANQSELDAQITAILTELTNANTNTDGTKRTQYTVNFKVNVDGVVTTVGTYTANYGDSLTLDASSVVGSATCNSWEVTTGTTRRFVNESNTYTLNIQSDATVVAYATAGATDSAPIAVSILNQYNKPFHNVALAGDTTIKFTANAVTIGGTTITIPTMPNYSIVGWTASGYASEIELDKTYTLSEIAGSGTSVVFGPTLTFTKADYTVKLDGVQVAAGVYDDLVTVNSQVAGTVAIALVQDGAYYVAAYGTSYSMYLNRNVEFVSIVKDGSNYYFSSVSDANRITDTQMTNKLNGGLPFVYSIMSVTGQNSSGTNKYTTFTATSANCTIEVTEVGTLYSKTASTDDTLVMGGSGVYSAAAKNPSATTNQFSYTIATKGNLYTRGYVKYTVTYTNAGGSATMQCIDYGNICTNAAN